MPAIVQPQRSDGLGDGADFLFLSALGAMGVWKQRLQGHDQPQPLQFWLASSGPPQATDLTHERLLRCLSGAMGRSE